MVFVTRWPTSSSTENFITGCGPVGLYGKCGKCITDILGDTFGDSAGAP